MLLNLSRRVRGASGTILLVLCVASGKLRAQSVNGALDLLFPTGARATAMGTAVAAEQGSEGVWWNPAGLARMTKADFALDHFSTFQVESGDAAALVLPFTPIGVLAVGARLFNFGSTPTTGANGEELGSASNHSLVLSGSFASSIGQRLSAGVTFRYYELSAVCSGICETVVSGNFTTAVLDAGIQVRPSSTSPIQFGALLSNVGPKLQVHDVQQADDVPARLHLGVSFQPTSPQWDPGIRVRTTLEFVSTPGLHEGEVHAGGELGYVTGQSTLSLRGGYIYQQASGPASSVGPSIGFGLASGRVQLDFAQVFDTFSTGLGKPPRYISVRVGL